MCGFVPLRDGIADDPRHTITLTADKTVTLHLNQEHTVDLARLAGVFDQPRTEVWTGVTFGPMKSMEWMYLWLACTQDSGLCRVTVEQSAVDSGLVNPMFQWGAMAVVGDRELAYLTWRGIAVSVRRSASSDMARPEPRSRIKSLRRSGPGARSSGTATSDSRFPLGGIDSSDPRGGRFFLDRPHNPITVIWQ